MAKISNNLIGAAGVHYVVSELSLRGLVALPTTRNTKGVDVLVFDPATNSQASIQVKTSQYRDIKFWPTGGPSKCLNGPNAFYVFLRLQRDKDGGRHFEAFLEKADDVVLRIRQGLQDLRQRGKVAFPSWGIHSPEEEAWFASNWKSWKPPSQP